LGPRRARSALPRGTQRHAPICRAGAGLLRRIAPLLILVALTGCGGPPREVTRTASFAYENTGATFLGQRVRQLGNPGDGRSGVRVISNGPEALGLRLVFSDRAERSIDAQYYLVHDDPAGRVFAWHLLKAADRGVRVRLLIDDMDTQGYDSVTAALAAHPNIEIRLFNPFWRDRGKALSALFEFGRINRRMHNKSMTFDNQVTIVGGRNIGSEYFSARDDINYYDLDVLGVGPITDEVSRSFDAYWNSPFAVPARDVIGDRAQTISLDEARARLRALVEEASASDYGQAFTQGIRQAVASGQFQVQWVPAWLVADPPEKAAGELDMTKTLSGAMLPYVAGAQDELFVVSAYFVPRKGGTALLTGLAQRGVKVEILTNSLESNDVEPVHAHYARSRKALLEAGVDLWELLPDQERPDRSLLDLGQSRSGLHGKAFAIDRRYLFIGSFNWDPRSARINTEMGVVIDSPSMARKAVRNLEVELPEIAYRLQLAEDGRIVWLERRGDGVWIAHLNEPSDSALRRVRTWVYGVLPIGGQL